MKIVLYLLLVASLSSKGPEKEVQSAPERVDAEVQTESLGVQAESFGYKLDDYRICKHDGSVVRIGSLNGTSEIEKMELRKATQEWENRFGRIFDDPNSDSFQKIFLKQNNNPLADGVLIEISPSTIFIKAFEKLNNNLKTSTAAKLANLLLYSCDCDYRTDFIELQRNIENYLKNAYSRNEWLLALKWFDQQRLSVVTLFAFFFALLDVIPFFAAHTSPSNVNATGSLDGSINISCLLNNETNTSLCSGKFFGNQTSTFSATSFLTSGISPWKINILICSFLGQFLVPWIVNILFNYCTAPITDENNKMMESASYLLAAYIICTRSQSSKGCFDKFALEDFPCQVAIRKAVYSCKTDNSKKLSDLVVKAIQGMK